jgi:hypothetical protein
VKTNTTFSDLNRFRSCLGFALSEMSESDSGGFWPCDGLANGTKWIKALHRKKELTQAKYKNETLSKRRGPLFFRRFDFSFA